MSPTNKLSRSLTRNKLQSPEIRRHYFKSLRCNVLFADVFRVYVEIQSGVYICIYIMSLSMYKLILLAVYTFVPLSIPAVRMLVCFAFVGLCI